MPLAVLDSLEFPFFLVPFILFKFFRLFLILPHKTQSRMIMSKPAKFSLPAIIEPDYDEGPLRREQRFKKICSIHQSKYYPIPCPPSLVSSLQYPANLVPSSIPHTVIIVKKQRPKVKDCIETESSSNGIKRKRAASTPSPQNSTMPPLVKRRPLFCAPLKIPSSPRSILPLGKPLAAAPSLPRLAAGRAIPKLYNIQ
jgi:hypothetical protein